MRMRSFLLATVVVLLLSPETRAAPGDLDPSFDGDGKIFLHIAEGGAFNGLTGLAIQPDGKIVAVGYIDQAGHSYDNYNDVVVVRFNTDGSLDTSFDRDGVLIIGDLSHREAAFDVAVQSDGKIVVGGLSEPAAGYGGSSLLLVRLNPDGSFDTTFDGDGRIISSEVMRTINTLALQSDGKILVGGMESVARFNSDGGVDTSFSTSSFSRILPSTNDILQMDDKIIVGGASSLRRFNPDGSLDTTFGGGAIPVTIDASPVGVLAVTGQPSDGKIIVGGVLGGATVLLRYNPDGTLDSSFGSGGSVTAAPHSIFFYQWHVSSEDNEGGRSIERKNCRGGWCQWL